MIPTSVGTWKFAKKIVSGNRVIDPSDGTVIQINDSWLVARNRPDMRTEDFVRYVILWGVALGIATVQVVPFLLLLLLIRMTGIAKFSKEQFHDPHTGYISLPVFRKLKNRKSVLYRVFRAFSLDRFLLAFCSCSAVAYFSVGNRPCGILRTMKSSSSCHITIPASFAIRITILIPTR